MEYRIASFNAKLFIKGSISVLPEQEIREMFYQLVGILQNISISVANKIEVRVQRVAILTFVGAPELYIPIFLLY